jgi:hypothetical protein
LLTPFGRRIVVDADSGAAWVAPIALARRIVRAQSLAAGGVDDESMGRRGLGADRWAPHDLGNTVTIDGYTLSSGAQIQYATSYTAPDGKLQRFRSPR